MDSELGLFKGVLESTWKWTQDSYSGFVFRIRILDSYSGFVFKIRIQDSYLGFVFRIRIQDSYLGFVFRIRIQDSYSASLPLASETEGVSTNIIRVRTGFR